MEETTYRNHQCAAHRKNGKRCKRHAILGGAVCPMHGGSAPQVKRAAQARLLAMVDPALGVLEFAMERKAKQLPEAIAAAKQVLDRAGLKSPQQIELSGPEGEPLFDLANVPTEKLEIVVALLRGARKPATEIDSGYEMNELNEMTQEEN